MEGRNASSRFLYSLGYLHYSLGENIAQEFQGQVNGLGIYPFNERVLISLEFAP
jgi:hypothetical protein